MTSKLTGRVVKLEKHTGPVDIGKWLQMTDGSVRHSLRFRWQNRISSLIFHDAVRQIAVGAGWILALLNRFDRLAQ